MTTRDATIPDVSGETGRLTPGAAAAIRSAIRLAGGREVCFVCTVNDTGVVQTARLHGGVTTLVTGAHGVLLLLKIALVALMIRLAARNRGVLAGHATATLTDDRRTRELLVRTSLTETAYGLGIVALTAVLVAVTPD